jgi:hypothetical protein
MKVKLDEGRKDVWVPDPLLLVLKAAIIWSTRHRQKLLPGCAETDESSADQDDDEIFSTVSPSPGDMLDFVVLPPATEFDDSESSVISDLSR